MSERVHFEEGVLERNDVLQGVGESLEDTSKDLEEGTDYLIYHNDSHEVLVREGEFRADELPDNVVNTALDNKCRLIVYDDVWVGGPLVMVPEAGKDLLLDIGEVRSSRIGLNDREDLEYLANRREDTEMYDESY